jgi:hypothetical protein
MAAPIITDVQNPSASNLKRWVLGQVGTLNIFGTNFGASVEVNLTTTCGVTWTPSTVTGRLVTVGGVTCVQCQATPSFGSTSGGMIGTFSSMGTIRVVVTNQNPREVSQPRSITSVSYLTPP